MSVEILYLSQIRQDGGTQPRGALNEETVLEYAAAMEDPSNEFPPVRVVFDGENYWLWDGYHRIAAAAEAGLDQFKAEVLQGTREDAQWLSFGANQTHGLRRTNADKRRAVEAALRHERGMTMSDNAIAEHCGVSHTFVGSVRRELTCNGCKSEVEAGAATPNLRMGRDGRAINVANIGSKKWQYFDKEADGTEVAHFRSWELGGAMGWVKIYVRELGPGQFIGAYEFYVSIPFEMVEPLSTEFVFLTRADAVWSAIDRACSDIDPQAEKALIHGYWPDERYRVILRNVRMALLEWAGESQEYLPSFWSRFIGESSTVPEQTAGQWPAAEHGLYPDDDVVRKVCWNGPRGCWMAIEVLQVGQAAWVARFRYEAGGNRGYVEDLCSEPVHEQVEDAIADAALRGGLHLDSIAERGDLPKRTAEINEYRYLRRKFADEAGQEVLDLEIWNEPAEEPARTSTVAQKLTKNTRQAEMEEAVRCIAFLAGVTDWRALGGLAGYAHDGAVLLGNVGYAKRNLTLFVKGLEAR